MASVDIELTDEETKALAEKYISSLDNDLDLQASFYTSNTRFIDPTSDLFGPAWDIVGGDKIIEFFKNASEESGTIAVKYKITNMLIERNYVVSNITSTVTACAVGLGFPKKSFTGDIDMVMMLQFEGESIQQRMDYVAYSAAWETMEQLQVNLADKNDDPRCSHHE